MAIADTLAHLRRRYSQDNPQALRNPWIIGWLGIIVMFLSINAVFIYLAITTSPGLVTEDYYEKGQQYEQNVLKLMAAQQTLQWETKLAVPGQIVSRQTGIYRFSAVDVRGVPVMDADVQLVAYRPSDADADIRVDMNQVAPGQYEARLALPLPGLWDLNITVKNGGDEFRLSHRISAARS